jgi:alkanesulfonate monooxygenase SsuD/methylene tetrahydromethanopterin reductase-like flavin-dependent oxidoreductase (luciferase family)
MDECLQILRDLADGRPVTFEGEFFSLHEAQIAPAPSPPIPLVVGGRSDAAVSRAVRLGDGWLGIWVSARRFAMVRDHITREAIHAGRDVSHLEHALNVWCGFAATRERARALVATQMEAFYQMPFEPFERYSPYGTPEDVAEFLTPYIQAGCSTFNVIPCAADDVTAIAAVGELRRLLMSSVTPLTAARRVEAR